ncbi:MAG: 1-acyl-sn-glycerol-3-phosphate acyltransferase [Treponema sp.]|nr:1-acyl-sn-glycerol-3-phosphate acyltransferase [Treponema sp.]
MPQKPKKWMKLRHRIIRNLLAFPFALVCKKKYGFTPQIVPDSDKRQFIIVMNHQTPFDQFFVGLSFKCPVYYVATEDIFSLGFLSRLLEWAVAPIPIKKSTQDMNAIRNIMQVAKEGGTICIFPEGNRTYSGCTEFVKPAITKLIKMTGLPVAVLKLEGGYGMEPRWSTERRKGKIKCNLARIMEPEDYRKMSQDEFYKEITDAFYVDDAASGMEFESDNKAEFSERLLYVCPECGLTHFKSSGNTVTCEKCGLTAEFTSDNHLKPVKGNLPYTTIKEWYDAQEKFTSALNPSDFYEKAVFSEKVDFYKVRLYRKKILLEENCSFDLYGDRFIINGIEYKFDDMKSVSILGRNKLNLYYKDEVFQIKADERFNGIKYLHFYYHYKNTVSEKDMKGEENEFLGL